MSSYKSGSYVKRNTLKEKTGTITVVRITDVPAHESDNVITPEEAWFDRLFSEEGSSSTSDWPESENSNIEENSVELLDFPALETPPVRPTSGKLSRLVSAGKCRLRLKKHCPAVILEKVIFQREQKDLPSKFLKWMTWRRYKTLDQDRLEYLWVKFGQRFNEEQLGVFVEGFYAYEYARLRRKEVLEFLDSLHGKYAGKKL